MVYQTDKANGTKNGVTNGHSNGSSNGQSNGPSNGYSDSLKENNAVSLQGWDFLSYVGQLTCVAFRLLIY